MRCRKKPNKAKEKKSNFCNLNIIHFFSKLIIFYITFIFLKKSFSKCKSVKH